MDHYEQQMEIFKKKFPAGKLKTQYFFYLLCIRRSVPPNGKCPVS